MWQIFGCSRKLSNDAHAVKTRHLYVEKHEIGLDLLDQIDRLQAIVGGADDLNFRIVLKQVESSSSASFSSSTTTVVMLVARVGMKC